MEQRCPKGCEGTAYKTVDIDEPRLQQDIHVIVPFFQFPSFDLTKGNEMTFLPILITSSLSFFLSHSRLPLAFVPCACPELVLANRILYHARSISSKVVVDSTCCFVPLCSAGPLAEEPSPLGAKSGIFF